MTSARIGVVVVGAGGHAKVCIDSLELSGHRVTHCVGLPGDPEECAGIPVVFGDERLEDLRDEGMTKAFIALGPNALRERLAAYARDLEYELVNAIHPSAIVARSAVIDDGVAIMAGAVINPEAHIGSLAIINTGATIDHDSVVGQAAHVAPQCAIAGNVTIGERTFLGIGSRVLPDIRIGRDVVVGAGAAVVSDLTDGLTVVGVPARPMAQGGRG